MHAVVWLKNYGQEGTIVSCILFHAFSVDFTMWMFGWLKRNKSPLVNSKLG